MKMSTKPKKASQVSSKGKAAPTQSKARGGAYSGRKPAAAGGESIFDHLLAMMPDEKRPELEKLRAKVAPGLQKFASALSQGNERFAQMLASCIQDSVTLDDAKAAESAYLANPCPPTAGLPLAAWEVTFDDAGFTLAAEVAAKHLKPPTKEQEKAQNLAASAGRDLTSKAKELTQGELQIVLEEVAGWLSEPESTGKARYKRLFFNTASGSLKFFTPKSRFGKMGKRLEADTLSLPQSAAQDVIKMLKAEKPPEAVLIGINNHQAATLEFVTRFIQKHTGKSGEMLESRAEWLEHRLCGLSLPEPEGSAEEQKKVKKRRKNISSWAKKRVRED
jgi:hypothetical protein